MSEEQEKLGTWKDVIVNFFENNIATSALYKARDYIDKKNNEMESEKDLKKKQRMAVARDNKIADLAVLRVNSPKNEIPKWITENSKKKGTIKKSTHVLRFTHSSSEADGLSLLEKSQDELLTTATLNSPVPDMAYNNGALVSVSRFLALRLDNQSIYDLVLAGEDDAFKSFSSEKETVKQWIHGFSAFIKNSEMKTLDKAKQLFFPLTNRVILNALKEPDPKNYNLLAPLFSSSLAEEIYRKQTSLVFDKKQKIIRKAKTDAKYHHEDLVSLPGLAVQKFGGAQPQNVSMLNKGRTWKANKKDKTTYGVTYLFKASPPAWQSQLKPPVYQKSLFGRGFYLPNSMASIDHLREFLLRFEIAGLSIKSPERMQWIKRWIGEITQDFLLYVISIQKLSAGWANADDIELKPEHQFLLDPFNSKEDFQSAKAISRWQAVICDDFAWWLNNRLRGKDKKFTPQAEHRRLWARLLEQPLREHQELVDAEYRRRAGERA